MSTVYVNSGFLNSQLSSVNFKTLQDAWDNYPGGSDAEIIISDSSSHSLSMNSFNSNMNSVTSLAIRGSKVFPDDYPTVTITQITYMPPNFEINKIILDGNDIAPSFPATNFISFNILRSVVRRYSSSLLTGNNFNSNSVYCEYSLFNDNSATIFNITGTSSLQDIYRNHLTCKYCTFDSNSSGVYTSAHSGLVTNEDAVMPVFQHCIISNSSVSNNWIIGNDAVTTNPNGMYGNCEFNLLGTASDVPLTISSSNVLESGTTFIVASPISTSLPSSWQLNDLSDGINFSPNGLISDIAESFDIADVRGDDTHDAGCWDATSVGRLINRPPSITTDESIFLNVGDSFSPIVSANDPDIGSIPVVTVLPDSQPTSDPRYNALWNSTSAVPTANTVTFNNVTNLATFASDAPPNGTPVVFNDIDGTMPTGIVAGKIYYVIDSSGNNFRISESLGGTQVGFTTDGSGTIYAYGDPYIVQYTATDNRGASVSKDQSVYVYSGARLYLDGANPQVIARGRPYVELGAYAIEGDGNIYRLDSININSSSVNTGVNGTYTVSYSYTAFNGVISAPITRDVTVVDPETLIITANADRYGNTNISIVNGHPYIESGATSSYGLVNTAYEITYPDSELLPDGELNPYYDASWEINSVSGIGKVYTIHYYSSYSEFGVGTTSSTTRVVTVVANQAPVIYINHDSNYNTGYHEDSPIKISSSSEYIDPGVTSYDYEDGIKVLPSDVIVGSDKIKTAFSDYQLTGGDMVTLSSTGTLPEQFNELSVLEISSISTVNNNNAVTLITTTDHGLSSSDKIVITDTLNFNGEYVVTLVNSTTVTFIGEDNKFRLLDITETSGRVVAGQFYWIRNVLGNDREVDFNLVDTTITLNDKLSINNQGSGIHSIVKTQQHTYSEVVLYPSLVPGTLDITTPGKYRLGYVVSDIYDPSVISTAYRYLEVIENERPALLFLDRSVTLQAGGSLVIDKLINSEFSEAVSAIDPEDGDVTASISWECSTSGYEYINSSQEVPQTLNMLGTFTVVYSVSDKDISSPTGYRISTYSLIVNVVNRMSLSLNGDPDNYIESQAYVEKGVSVSGGFSGSITTHVTLPSSSVVIGGSGNNAYFNPKWNSINLAVGEYTILYRVIDVGGNIEEITRNISVVPNSPAQIELVGDGADNSYTFVTGSTWREPGYSVIDDLDGHIGDELVTVLPSDMYYPSTHPNALSTNPYYDDSWDSNNLVPGNDSSKLYRRNGVDYYVYTVLYYVIDSLGKYSSITRNVYVRAPFTFIIELNGSSQVVYPISSATPYIELGAIAKSTSQGLSSDVLTRSMKITIYDSEDLNTPLQPPYLQKNIKLGEFQIDSSVINPAVVNTYKIKYTVTSPDGDESSIYRTVIYNNGIIPQIRLL